MVADEWNDDTCALLRLYCRDVFEQLSTKLPAGLSEVHDFVEEHSAERCRAAECARRAVHQAALVASRLQEAVPLRARLA